MAASVRIGKAFSEDSPKTSVLYTASKLRLLTCRGQNSFLQISPFWHEVTHTPPLYWSWPNSKCHSPIINTTSEMQANCQPFPRTRVRSKQLVSSGIYRDGQISRYSHSTISTRDLIKSSDTVNVLSYSVQPRCCVCSTFTRKYRQNLLDLISLTVCEYLRGYPRLNSLRHFKTKQIPGSSKSCFYFNTSENCRD